MRLQIVTPDRQLLDEEIEEVYAPGVSGQFGVLPEHVNFLTALDTGELRYRSDGVDNWVAIRGGVAEVLDDLVTILADSAELDREIDVDAVKEISAKTAEALKEVELDVEKAADLEAELAWANTRESVFSRR